MSGFWHMAGPVWQSVAVIVAMGMMNVGGSLAFKDYVADGNAWMLAAGALAWALGAALYIRLLGMQDLALIAMASAVIQVCLVIAAGLLLFNESVGLRQVIAMSIAVAAMTVAMVPGAPR